MLESMSHNREVRIFVEEVDDHFALALRPKDGVLLQKLGLVQAMDLPGLLCDLRGRQEEPVDVLNGYAVQE